MKAERKCRRQTSLPTQARVVSIGGGISGCSMACRLANPDPGDQLHALVCFDQIKTDEQMRTLAWPILKAAQGSGRISQ